MIDLRYYSYIFFINPFSIIIFLTRIRLLHLKLKSYIIYIYSHLNHYTTIIYTLNIVKYNYIRYFSYFYNTITYYVIRSIIESINIRDSSRYIASMISSEYIKYILITI